MKINPEHHTMMRRSRDGPAWRHRWAKALLAAGAASVGEDADITVRACLDYLRHQAGGHAERDRGSQLYPHIAAALALADDGLTRDLKVLVMGNCPPEEIARRLGLEIEVVRVWEELFFDVRPAREAIDWVLTGVIQPEAQAGNGTLAAQLKFAAAGPAAARAILDASTRVSLNQGVTLFDRKITLMTKMEEANQRPLESERGRLLFIKLHADRMQRERQLRLAERRLEARCQEALAKQQRAEQRLEQRRERSAQQAQWRAAQEQKRDQRQAKKLRQQAAEIAQAQAREERKRLIQERAASCPLAMLRWQTSDTAMMDPVATAQPGVAQDRTDNRAGLSVAATLAADGNTDTLIFEEEKLHDQQLRQYA